MENVYLITRSGRVADAKNQAVPTKELLDKTAPDVVHVQNAACVFKQTCDHVSCTTSIQ